MDYVYTSTMDTVKGITHQVTALIDLGLYNSNTNSLKSAYNQKLKLYEEYEEDK